MLKESRPALIEPSPAGDRWVKAYANGVIEILDPRGLSLARRALHTGAVRSTAFSPRGDLFATTSDDGTARLWDTETGAALATFTGHEGPVLAVAFSHDGERIATGGADGTIRIFPVRPVGLLALACSRLRGTDAWPRVQASCWPD
jgi:WD40 repeat protein